MKPQTTDHTHIVQLASMSDKLYRSMNLLKQTQDRSNNDLVLINMKYKF